MARRAHLPCLWTTLHALSCMSPGMGDMRGLVETIKETVGDDTKPEMLDKMSKGIFTLRDMYEQFTNVMKLGPLHKVMGMIPGIPQGLLSGANENEVCAWHSSMSM